MQLHSFWHIWAELLLFVVADVVKGEKAPTKSSIDDYDDPILREIFGNANQRRTQTFQGAPPSGDGRQNHQQRTLEVDSSLESFISSKQNTGGESIVVPLEKNMVKTVVLKVTTKPELSGIDPNARPPPGNSYNLAGGRGYSTIGTEYAPTLNTGPYAGQISGGGLDPLVTGWTSLAAQGAQNFYAGVRQAGRFFGIDTGQYQPYEIPLISEGAKFFGRR